MSYRLKYFLLPIMGAVAAFLSFFFAHPYEKTLIRPWLKPSDPEYHFTFGTLWTNVQHATFGAILCGSFCFILEIGRRTPRRVLFSTILGTVLGAILNSCADSGSDYIGILAMRASGPSGQFLGEMAWFVLVPASMSLTIALAVGPTRQRMARAIFSTIVAAIFTFIGRAVADVIAAARMMTSLDVTKLAQGDSYMLASISIWMTEAVVVGVALGLTVLIADVTSRRASLRLVHGRNEFRDWSLDYQANRIGSGEVEIPIRGYKGVEPVHACIFRQGNQFILDCQHFPGLLNGQPVTQAPLGPGDTIQIGEATLVFHSGGAVRPARQMMPQYPQGYQPPGYPQPGIPQPGMPAGAFPQQGPPQPVAPGPDPMMQSQPVPAASLTAVVAPEPIVAYALADLSGKPYPLSPGVNTVGRDAGNTVFLPSNTTVSRRHATVTVENDQVVVADSGSANGTRVNRLPMTAPTALNPGDEVAFGSAVFTLQKQS
ncbi:MAG: FHA domain-containing protein [Armatimonadetes bacterium]|nr:FHA domain-containing protein [Armatimonadota bacterium]